MLVSLIVPVYNAEKTLEHCLKSIVQQTVFDKIEVVLVDDGSKDSSGAICDRYAALFPNILAVHQRNAGVLAARSAGINMASAAYIMFVDSDDWIEKQYVEYSLKLASATNADIVVTSAIVEEKYTCEKVEKNLPDSYEIFYCATQQNLIYKNLIFDGRPFSRRITASLWAKLFKKILIDDLLKKVDKRICIGEDAAITYPAIMNANIIVESRTALYHYFQNPTSMTHRYSPNYPLQAKLLYKHLLQYQNVQNRYDFTAQIEGNYISMLVSAVSNLFQCGAPNRNIQMKELRSICEDQEVHKIMLHFDFSLFNIKEKIVCHLLKHGRWRELWIYEKLIQTAKWMRHKLAK